jgi:Spx/MgsR family transcriptional regulator
MIKLYGIKSCDGVKKAIKYLKNNNLEYQFIDLKITVLDNDIVNRWLENISLDILFNKRSRTYRDLKLKELDLDDEDKIDWLIKEPLLIKRPIIELDDSSIMVGYNQLEYNKKLL